MDSDGQRSAGGRAEIVGHVVEQLPSALYRVKLDGGALVTAHIADRTDRNFIRVLVGDRVRLELSPVDRGRGRIVEKIA
jgi:translation initiation factor IF-1